MPRSPWTAPASTPPWRSCRAAMACSWTARGATPPMGAPYRGRARRRASRSRPMPAPARRAAAIAAARRAFDDGPWPRMTGAGRSKLLLDVADLIERDAELLATLDVLEGGKPIAQVRAEIAGAVDIWRYAAAPARDLHGECYGT